MTLFQLFTYLDFRPLFELYAWFVLHFVDVFKNLIFILYAVLILPSLIGNSEKMLIKYIYHFILFIVHISREGGWFVIFFAII